MTLRLAPRTSTLVQPHPLWLRIPTTDLPTLWTELDQLRQQQLAQHLAELIRRIRLQPDRAEGSSHEQS